MNILKSILLIFFTLFLMILEISWPNVPRPLSFILILIIVLLIESSQDISLSNFKPKYILILAIFGGIVLDIYSIFPPGLFFLALSATTYIAHRFILPRFSLASFLSIFVIGILSSLVYQLLILITSYLYYFLNLLEARVIFDQFYWTIFWQAVIGNGLLILVFSLAVKLIGAKYKRLR
ncbi:hypothetical protein IID20_03705 [Patescibacteria group bacterium]|nr:hypothetical protein [Patescibacteria group bacterium]